MYYKTDQHSSSSCKGTSGLLHIMGSNTMIFAVLKACVILSCYATSQSFSLLKLI